MKKQYQIPDDIIASHGQRVANYLLDMIFQIVILVCIVFFLTIAAVLAEWDGLIAWMQNMPLLHQYLMGAVMAIVYYGMSETLMGRTLGKMISGTVVVMEDGSVPDADVILKRTFCRLIPFDWVSFLGSSARGWHDTIPGVYVVDKKRFEASKKQFLTEIPLES